LFFLCILSKYCRVGKNDVFTGVEGGIPEDSWRRIKRALYVLI
jgi:hypothetical protein